MPTDSPRTLKKIDYAHIITFTVTATKVATKGKFVIISGNMTVEDATAGDDTAIGVALESATAGNRVTVALPGPVVPCLVGTGGTTRGKKQKTVADGITDAPTTLNAGATTTPIVGVALESGVALDIVGVVPMFSNRISA